MLHAVTEQNQLSWYCPGSDDDECGQLHVVDLEAVEYQAPGANGKGAVIALPPCECGVQTFLKAHYTLKELFRAVLTVQNDVGETWAYALKLSHVHNLHAHHLLYQRGLAEHPPILALPPREVLEHPQFVQIGNPDVVYSLWFGYTVTRQHLQAIAARRQARIAKPDRPLIAVGETQID